MSDLKQRKQKKKKEEENPAPAPPDEPSKEEYKIAKWMRDNVPIKKTKFLNHTVEYFTACVAIDKLMDSAWAKPAKEGEEALFTTRESVVDYLETMLRHKLFHRARKIVVPESELKPKKKKNDKDTGKDNKDAKEKTDDEKTKKKEEAVTAAESSQAEGDKGEEGKKQKKDGGEKKKRKIRLDMHLHQTFVDGTDAYVWIYEPTPYYYYIFGTLVVIAIIAVCLFPLWPSSVRQGVYYLSLAAAGFLVFILALAVIRLLVFCVVWGLSFGRHHLWLLPNLTEDVGFFASFWPLFKYEYNGEQPDTSKSKKKEEKDTEPAQSSSGSNDTTNTAQSASQNDHSETESECSQKSQIGKDFEMVEHDEMES